MTHVEVPQSHTTPSHVSSGPHKIPVAGTEALITTYALCKWAPWRFQGLDGCHNCATQTELRTKSKRISFSTIQREFGPEKILEITGPVPALTSTYWLWNHSVSPRVTGGEIMAMQGLRMSVFFQVTESGFRVGQLGLDAHSKNPPSLILPKLSEFVQLQIPHLWSENSEDLFRAVMGIKSRKGWYTRHILSLEGTHDLFLFPSHCLFNRS